MSKQDAVFGLGLACPDEQSAHQADHDNTLQNVHRPFF